MTTAPQWSPGDDDTADLTGGRCGTVAGYQVHGNEGTPRCAACQEASREYSRARRARTDRTSDIQYNAARARALTRLSKLHPGQFKILMDEEMGR